MTKRFKLYYLCQRYFRELRPVTDTTTLTIKKG